MFKPKKSAKKPAAAKTYKKEKVAKPAFGLANRRLKPLGRLSKICELS